MVTLQQLVYYLEGLLQPDGFKDYAPNGLQVEGKSSINTLVTGVTANQALIDAAIQHQADAILVHHGFFWKNETPTLVGMKYKRIKSLMANDISLLAYHLPLDAHPIYGNNIQLGKLLNIEFMATFPVEPGLFLGYQGRFHTPLTGQQFAEMLASKLGRTPFYIPGQHAVIETIAWCTGAAQDYLPCAILQKVDAYLTGEVSERTFHIARENGIHFYAAGHHATERYGVSALGEHLSQELNVNHLFIDIENPV
jgi:dinuclear metal center YbgI/SA1388 family protein